MSPTMLLCLQKMSSCNKLWPNVRRRWLTNIKPCFMKLPPTTQGHCTWKQCCCGGVLIDKLINCTKDFVNDFNYRIKMQEGWKGIFLLVVKLALDEYNRINMKIETLFLLFGKRKKKKRRRNILPPLSF